MEVNNELVENWLNRLNEELACSTKPVVDRVCLIDLKVLFAL